MTCGWRRAILNGLARDRRVKGVFEVSGNSRYDDEISNRYHFPNRGRYKETADQLVGDWIVYRETRAAGGSMSYTGVGFVDRIDPDPLDPTHFYARISQYLKFNRPIPYRNPTGRFAEQFLRDLDRPADAGRTLRGGSVRELQARDFVEIVDQGLSDTLSLENRIKLGLDAAEIDYETARQLSEPPTERRIEAMLINRKIRDASFRRQVLDAYDNRCAVTRLRIVNGGGRVEAQAAHIWPVAHGGPDTVQNGIALSATAHWLFDRHLISLDENYRLLVSDNKVPSELKQLFPPAGESIRLPSDRSLYPSHEYIARHRDVFGGLS